jgi:hypothetical protein
VCWERSGKAERFVDAWERLSWENKGTRPWGSKERRRQKKQGLEEAKKRGDKRNKALRKQRKEATMWGAEAGRKYCVGVEVGQKHGAGDEKERESARNDAVGPKSETGNPTA